MSDNTNPGAVDDDAPKRAKKNKRDKQQALQDIVDDNTTGRPQHPDGQGQ